MEEFVGQYVNHIGSGVHPNGTVFLLVAHKTGVGIFKAEIWRHDPGAKKPVYHSTIPLNGPAGYGTLECMPDGSLRVYTSAGLVNEHNIGGNFIGIPNMAQPWKVIGDVVLLPVVPTSTGVDVMARNTAQVALNAAQVAKTEAATAQKAASAAAKGALNVGMSLEKIKVPTLQDIKDIAWSLAGDRISAEAYDDGSDLTDRIETLSQERLVAAIEYALSNPKQSRLRAMIEKVIEEKLRHATAQA